MENSISTDDLSKCSDKRSNSRDSTGSLPLHKSSKKIEKHTSNTNSFKSEKDVQFAIVKDGSCEKVINNDGKPTVDISVKVPHKFIANWKKACDHTRDKTKDLLKRWRTLPECESADKKEQASKTSGWSVHVWTTWVDRVSLNNSKSWDQDTESILTPTQCNKLIHFFKCLLDHDNDEIISSQDFQALSERLRHFADWSTNSVEFNILKQVEQGFMECFLREFTDAKLGFKIKDEWHITVDGWLQVWSQVLHRSKTVMDFPLWLQYFVKIMFHVVNRSGSGNITKDELASFYSSVLLFSLLKVNEIIDTAYQAMTSMTNYKTNK
ncbi:uncharacterized protein LOC108738231 isoform X2 [Agrilus planipennis]|uniref:Uncharacterized protein LOC108738231 isoform X2 n=1 Tax=Agrilus planipennis TaxID=224129 RepID=A0A1W4WT33_AGRPL|nr:uncharacterized protein LOC108738231 isoform X2 [Agrilus planipennis]